MPISPAHNDALQGEAVRVIRANGVGAAVLVCEHASNHIPTDFGTLGLSAHDLTRHIAWDPGAFAVADLLSASLDAPLIAGGVSRLLFDTNRPPHAPDAILTRSEIFEIPGNQTLDHDAKEERITRFHDPFRDALVEVLDKRQPQVLITVHSFTPVYSGQKRNIEIGILHDSDSRLADAMLHIATQHTQANVQRNEPYGPQHGVTHTLRTHALPRGILNVMLEIRNDLIAAPVSQRDVADMLAVWIAAAMTMCVAEAGASCSR